MKQKTLPTFGYGPFYVLTIFFITLFGIYLDSQGFLVQGRLPGLKVLFYPLGGVLMLLGVTLWVKAVLQSKIVQEVKKNHLITSGVYAYVRHPIYAAFLLFFTGVLFFFSNWYLLCLPIFFTIFLSVLMKHTEEKWLLALYGKEYEEYARKVNRCIPWFPKQ